MGFRWTLGCIVPVAVVATGCREPTQIRLELSTDVDCVSVTGTNVYVAASDSESLSPVASTSACKQGGEIGSLVLVPSGDDSAAVAIRVVTGLGKTPEECVQDGYEKTDPDELGCIVSRRRLRFVAHENLSVPVRLQASCVNAACKPTETCEAGQCVPIGCTGAGCDTDGGVDAGPGDGGCADGSCGACVPGSFRCEGHATSECSADSNWLPATSCSGTTPFCANGACVGVEQLVGGDAHSCARMSNGTVFCWGANDRGQLGIGSTEPKLEPTQVPGLVDVIAIDAGGMHSCALTLGRTLKCWGANGTGQLGNDSSGQDETSPIDTAGIDQVDAFDLGYNASCAIRLDGTAWCWGSNSGFKLGTGEQATVVALLPKQVPNLSGATTISIGMAHTCAVLTSGAAKCWGSDHYAIGIDTCCTGKASPADVVESGWARIAVNESSPPFTCGRSLTGAVECWGWGIQGELGNGLTQNAYIAQSTSILSGAAEVDTGAHHACARGGDGSLRCWGNNEYGAIGNGDQGDGDPGTQDKLVLTPVEVASLPSIDHLGMGNQHTCAIAAGKALCWGLNTSGQLGNGSQTSSPTPVEVAFP